LSKPTPQGSSFIERESTVRVSQRASTKRLHSAVVLFSAPDAASRSTLWGQLLGTGQGLGAQRLERVLVDVDRCAQHHGPPLVDRGPIVLSGPVRTEPYDIDVRDLTPASAKQAMRREPICTILTSL
jgi:hypothetical protein